MRSGSLRHFFSPDSAFFAQFSRHRVGVIITHRTSQTFLTRKKKVHNVREHVKRVLISINNHPNKHSGGGGDIWYYVPHLQNSGGGGACPLSPLRICAHVYNHNNDCNLLSVYLSKFSILFCYCCCCCCCCYCYANLTPFLGFSNLNSNGLYYSIQFNPEYCISLMGNLFDVHDKQSKRLAIKTTFGIAIYSINVASEKIYLIFHQDIGIWDRGGGGGAGGAQWFHPPPPPQQNVNIIIRSKIGRNSGKFEQSSAKVSGEPFFSFLFSLSKYFVGNLEM